MTTVKTIINGIGNNIFSINNKYASKKYIDNCLSKTKSLFTKKELEAWQIYKKTAFKYNKKTTTLTITH